MANEEQPEIDPLPGLPPNRRTDLGEGECSVFMETIIPIEVELTPPPIVIACPAAFAGSIGEVREGVHFGGSRAWFSGVCRMANTLPINNGIL